MLAATGLFLNPHQPTLFKSIYTQMVVFDNLGDNLSINPFSSP